ncbi:MAG TPA: glycosyltransferase [bacterium]|nr:glycosyltransferase [bacterium]HQL60988.1 glycosyltransferase [bacterium]
MNSNPRTLLIVTTDSVIAGTERMILAYLERHDPAKYRPYLVTLIGPGDLIRAAQDLNIPGEHLNIRSSFKAAWKLRQVIRRIRPALVHSYLFHTNILTRMLRPISPIPKLVCGMATVYAPGAYPNWYYMADRYTHFLCDRVIAVCEAGRESLIQMAAIPPDKVEVVPNGVFPDLFGLDRSTARKDILMEFSLPADVCLLGIVAQLRPQKHHDILFRAMRALKDTNLSAHLLVIGDGSGRARLEELRTELNLEKDITFAGYRTDVSHILAGLDIFVLPSSVEGSPVSVLEAMASGLPVIAGDAGGVKELVVDGTTGILIPPTNLARLTEAILFLVSQPETRVKFGTAGKQRIEAEFTLDRMARRTEAVYDSLFG